MDWRHGYYAESGYTYGYYPETMPVRLRWAALIQGQGAPSHDFRYLDAGCGQGYNLILAALAHPDSTFVGIDFMPEHIAHGRDLAKRMGLRNVSFIEADFLELADDPSALGEFDYAVCHGITSWIEPKVRSGLFRLIGRVLAPGGVFYNSYNTHPGWLPSVPFQHLVLLEQQSKAGAAAITAAMEHIDAVRKASVAFDKTFPGLEARMNDLKSRDPSYLVQEYNNHHWEPLFVSQMMAEMAAVKLEYLGTATLSEAFKSHIPADVRDRAGPNDTVLREQLADYAISQGFRRDLYVKGRNRPWRAERNEMTREARFIANPLVARPKDDEPYKIKAGGLELKAPRELYDGYVDRIAQQPDGCSFASLMDAEGDQKRRTALVENISMLLHGGWILPLLPETPASPAPALRALAKTVADGAPYGFFPLPTTGCATHMSEIDVIAIEQLLEGVDEAKLSDAVTAGLARGNRFPLKDGKAVRDPAEMRQVVGGLIAEFAERRLPFLRRCGVL